MLADRGTGPRNRAPLGNKTTNAKATAFQTPAPPSAQPTSPRMRRAKIKVHEAEPETQDDHEEREIEYMPPREIPLPDLPEDDWPIDRTCPQFEGKNLTCGWYTEYMARKKDDDEDDEFSDFEQKLKRIEELNEKKKQAQQAKKGNVVKKTALHKTTRDPLALKPAQSLTARGAASALSSTEPTPSFAAPTAAAKARLPSALQSKKVSALTATGDTRHTAAKVASNSTLGYSKGRAVSASARAPLSSIHERPTEASAPRPSFAQCSLNELFGHQNLDIKDEDADLGLGDSSNDLGEEEGGVQVFQLDTVEL